MIVGTIKNKANFGTNTILIDHTDNQLQLAEWYSVADVFVNLTYEDTYPSVNIEAQCCGTPVLTYKTGGSVETVPVENIVEQGDIYALLNKIENEDYKRLAININFNNFYDRYAEEYNRK